VAGVGNIYADEALFRARVEGAPDGALRAADGFVRLGDRDAAVLALRIAETVAARHGDDEVRARVRAAADRILRPAADLTRSAQPGS